MANLADAPGGARPPTHAGRALTHPRLAMAAGGPCCSAGVGAWLGTTQTFITDDGRGDLLLQLQKPASVGLQRSLDTDAAVGAAISQVPRCATHVTRRSDELGLDPMGLNETDMFMQLAPRDAWQVADKGALADRIRAVMADFRDWSSASPSPSRYRVWKC